MNDFNILLVEDNEGDIVLTLKALEITNFKNKVAVVKDGEKALQFLKKEGSYQQALTPGLIFLDINLPKLNGKEVLHFIKSHPQFKTIPVIVLTTSNAHKDIEECYFQHANCFITKPDNFNGMIDTMEAIRHFWTGVVKFPELNVEEEKN